jgi:cytochrome c oxidase subunit 3
MLLYVSYIALRLGRTPEQPFVVPRSFWGSTALLLSISGLLHLAILAARRDQLMQVTIRTGLALILALGFLLLQSESMVSLIELTKSLGRSEDSPYPYTIILAILHALHVVAGLVGLSIVVVKSVMNRYDHENFLGLEMCAIYWHFLDIVWIVMLTSFYIASGIYNSIP